MSNVRGLYWCSCGAFIEFSENFTRHINQAWPKWAPVHERVYP